MRGGRQVTTATMPRAGGASGELAAREKATAATALEQDAAEQSGATLKGETTAVKGRTQQEWWQDRAREQQEAAATEGSGGANGKLQQMAAAYKVLANKVELDKWEQRKAGGARLSERFSTTSGSCPKSRSVLDSKAIGPVSGAREPRSRGEGRLDSHTIPGTLLAGQNAPLVVQDPKGTQAVSPVSKVGEQGAAQDQQREPTGPRWG